MHLKYSENTGSQNCVYKSRTAHRIQIKMFLEHQILICEKIHSCQSMNFDVMGSGEGLIIFYILYFIFYILYFIFYRVLRAPGTFVPNIGIEIEI